MHTSSNFSQTIQLFYSHVITTYWIWIVPRFEGDTSTIIRPQMTYHKEHQIIVQDGRLAYCKEKGNLWITKG
jgi:hypothetical protein